TFPIESEIAWSSDQALPEMIVPDPIGKNPGCQRVLIVADPACQRQSTLTFRSVHVQPKAWKNSLQGAQTFGRNSLGLIHWITPLLNIGRFFRLGEGTNVSKGERRECRQVLFKLESASFQRIPLVLFFGGMN